MNVNLPNIYTVLIIEDEQDLSSITEAYLRAAHYNTATAFTGMEALEKLSANTFDLILMDVMLPDYNGTELCLKVRQNTNSPIIFMSCLDDNHTIVSALLNGGDDYVVKPVNFPQLLARIEANIRRHGESISLKDMHIATFKRFKIDLKNHKVFYCEIPIDLTATEYALLVYLTQNPNTLVLYNDLYRCVWGSDCCDDIRGIMVHISNLRKKIDPEKAGIIATVRGAGYIFTDV